MTYITPRTITSLAKFRKGAPILSRSIQSLHTTDDKIKWLESHLKTEAISGQICYVFQSIFNDTTKDQSNNPFKSLSHHFGFTLRKYTSTIPNSGYGLFLDGKIAAASVVAIYPGVLYHPGDPSLFPSLRNDYIIKRMDGSCLDGKYWGLSKYMYTSIAMRDGPTATFDNTWHTVKDPNWYNTIKSPLAMGQMINNCTDGNPNVTYFEFEFPNNFPQHLWQFIPNINYQGSNPHEQEGGCLVKSIAMITLRDIVDEELFSTYSWVGISQV